jgi:hypothetical protein
MLILFKLNAIDNTCLNINIDIALSAILILAELFNGNPLILFLN